MLSSETYVNKCDKDCEARVIKSETLTEAENHPWPGGDFKIARVLSEFVVQIDSEAEIRLNEPAYEIKRIDKQIFLKQCRYISTTNKVFIEGYIRKNIEYARKPAQKQYHILCNHDTTVHVPFKFHTKVVSVAQHLKSYPIRLHGGKIL